MNDDETNKALQAEKKRLLEALKVEEENFKKGFTSVKQLRDAEARISDRLSRIILELSFLTRAAAQRGETK